MTRRNREQERADRELRVFVDFAELARELGLRVRPGSAVSRPTPAPDILCDIEGEGPVAFELVDSTLAENISVAARRNEPADGAWVGDPTMERILGKVDTKTYATPHPMELLAWSGAMITPPSVWIPMFEERLRGLRGRSGFRRLWFVNLGVRRDERGVWLVDPPLITRKS
jgi:hypothetical protein